MNYIEARQLLDKQPLPARPQQAVNVLLDSIDQTQGAIDDFLTAYGGTDPAKELITVSVLKIVADKIKEGREAVGA